MFFFYCSSKPLFSPKRRRHVACRASYMSNVQDKHSTSMRHRGIFCLKIIIFKQNELERRIHMQILHQIVCLLFNICILVNSCLSSLWVWYFKRKLLCNYFYNFLTCSFLKDQPITSFPIAVHKFHARESPTSRDQSEPRSAIHERVDNDDDK